MKYTDFAQKIKAKYPDYADIDDRELAEKMIAKYPEYESQVEFDEGDKIAELRSEADRLRAEADEASSFGGLAKETIKGIKDSFVGFKDSIMDTGAEEIPFAGDIVATKSIYDVYSAGERLKQGTASAEDKETLQDYFTEQEALGKKRENFGYSLGEGIRNSLSFGVEIAGSLAVAPVTGGTSVGALIAKKGALKTAKIYAEKIIKDEAVRGLLTKELAQYGVQATKRGIVGGGAFTLSNAPKDAVTRMIGNPTYGENGEIEAISDGQSIEEATINAISSNLVEIGSEFTGGMFNVLGKPVKTVLVKAGVLKSLATANPSIPASKLSQLVTTVSKKMGWNGVLQEFGEERVAQAMNEALYELGLGDQPFKMPTMRDLALELAMFSVMGGGIKAFEKALNSVGYAGAQEGEGEDGTVPPDGDIGGELDTKVEELADEVRSKLALGATPNEVALDLSGKFDTQEAKDFVDSVVEKDLADTKTTHGKTLDEAKATLDTLMEQVKKAKTTESANALLEKAVEQGTLTQKKLDQIRKLVPSLAVDKATLPTKTKQPAVKKPKEAKVPTGEGVKEPAVFKAQLVVDGKRVVQPVKVKSKFEQLGKTFVTHREVIDGKETKNWVVSEFTTGLTTGVIAKTEKEAIELSKSRVEKVGQAGLDKVIERGLGWRSKIESGEKKPEPKKVEKRGKTKGKKEEDKPDVADEAQVEADKDWEENYAEEAGERANKISKLKEELKNAPKAKQSAIQKKLDEALEEDKEIEEDFLQKWRNPTTARMSNMTPEEFVKYYISEHAFPSRSGLENYADVNGYAEKDTPEMEALLALFKDSDTVDVPIDTEDKEGDNEDNGTSGTDNNDGEPPAPVPVGTDGQGGAGADDTSTRQRPRRKKQPPADNDVSGTRSGARLTNEQIAEKVSAVATIDENGLVQLTGKVTDELKEIANQYTSGGVSKEGAGILDEYYTSSRIVDMVRSLFTFGDKPLKVREPSVGTGNFLYALPEGQKHVILTNEINPITARIAKIFHPDAIVSTKSFEDTFVDERGNKKEVVADTDLVIGNPPYGEHRGKYLGLGEEKQITRYDEYFMKRGLDTLKEGGTLAMVVPSGFLRKGVDHAKTEMALMGELVVAYRLPNGAFESTDVGTDIVVFRKAKATDSHVTMSRVNAMSNDSYFKGEGIINILGKVETRKGKFGEEEFVAGTLEDAITHFETVKNTGEALKVLADLGLPVTTENMESAEEAVEEAGKGAEEIMKEEQKKKGKETIEKKIVKKVAPSKDGTVALSSLFDHQHTEEELAHWKATGADKSLAPEFKHNPEISNYMNGKWYIDFAYLMGDVYEKLDALEKDKKTMGEEQYNRQKEKLTAIIPKREQLTDTKISPNIEFTKTLMLDREEATSLRGAFLKWINTLPREAFGLSNAYEVREFANEEQVRGGNKDLNERIRDRRRSVANDLFVKFLTDGLTLDEQRKVEDEFNRTFNFYHTPDYSQVPMFSSINATYKGKPLELRDVQMQGIGRLVFDGVGILAHDVGYGKTLQGIIATAEMVHRGWAKRPLITVPSENVYRQWISDIGAVIPNATINQLGNLGATFKGDLSTLVIPEGSFSISTYEGLQRLSFKDATYDSMSSKFKYISDDLNSHKSNRQKEKTKKDAERMGGAMKKGTRADIYFENLGFDLLTFDEMHNANHIVSKVKLEKGQASEFNAFGLTPSDLGIKTWLASQFIQEKNGGRNVFGLTATPFTNHPLEYYSILSLIADKSLTRMGAQNVNTFFGTFMEAESKDEFKANGKYEKRVDIRRFRNYRQFRKLLTTYIDFREGEAKGLNRPNRLQRTYEIPANAKQRQLAESAQEMFKDKQGAGTLRAIGELRKIAFSPFASVNSDPIGIGEYKRFVEESPKIKTMMELIAQNKADKSGAGQIVYTEIGVDYLPHMAQYLIKEVGYKAEEVAIISGATPKAKRGVIQDDFNKGKIKVLLGSEAIKEGMNLQENTTDLYVLSLPWNFTQLRQVIGRAWRHGNKWKNVRINNMFIQNSVDVFMSQKLENKQSRYESTIFSGDNDVDVGDIDFDEMKFELVTDPELRAKLQLQGQEDKIANDIVQAKAELAFSTRKMEKIAKIDKDLESAQDMVAREKKKIDAGEEKDTWWLENQTKQVEKLNALKDEELGKLSEKGIDVASLTKQLEDGKAEIKALEEKQSKLKDNYANMVAEIKATLPTRQEYTPEVLAKFRAERAEDNKTFYELRAPAGKETVAVKQKVKEIKNGKGVVVKKKTSTEVERKPVEIKPKRKSGTKDTAMLKVLIDPKLSVKEKVRTLLDKKQEGKKYKDSGERVAGSKKENAVIQAVIEHGDSAILKLLASELGNDTVLAQLDKKKITEDMEVPSAEVERTKKTPAFIANFKVNVWNRVARTPEIRRKSGRYNSHKYVRDGMEEDFVAGYPDALRQFTTDLNAISTVEQAVEFQTKYRNYLLQLTGKADSWDTSKLEQRRTNVQNPNSYEYIKDEAERTAEVANLTEQITSGVITVGVDIDVIGKDFNKTMRIGNVSTSGKFSVDTWRGAYNKYTDALFILKKTDAKKEEIEEANALIKDLTENYDKFLPVATSGKTKQLVDAEAKVKALTESLDGYRVQLIERIEEENKDAEKSKTGWNSANWIQERIQGGEEQLAKATEFLARLKGETPAIEHGNFQQIEEYDVKDSRFKKTFVNTENLMKVYGFKSAQLGNYMDDVSSHEHIVQAMGAMEDMGKILDMDIAKFANKSGLSIAFGARGGGGSAVAHFEPTHKIINITKKRGDGSFGHEFMHAMDWLIGASTRGGRWSSKRNRYLRVYGDLESLRLTDAFVDGVRISTDKEFTPQPITEYQMENDSLIKRMVEKRKDDVSFENVLQGLYNPNERELQAVSDVYRKTFTYKVGKTSKKYYEDSLAYGGGKDTSYWVKKEELWARAFQAYLEDKMEELGIKNNYLTRSTKDISVYPQGEERTAYNKMFDALFAQVKLEYPVMPQDVGRTEPRFKTTGEPQTAGTDGYRFLIDVKQRLNLDFDVIWVDSILSQDGGAWGVTHDNAIAIAKDAPKWTAEHETVHLTTANLNKIPIFQRNGITRERLLTAQAQQMGLTATKENLRDIEEGLAEGFEQFMEGKSNSTGVVRKFFTLLKLLVARLAKAVRLTDGNIILDYYDILAHGEEVDDKMVVMEREGILEAFINEGTMTIPAIGSRFKTTGVQELTELRGFKIGDEVKVTHVQTGDVRVGIIKKLRTGGVGLTNSGKKEIGDRIIAVFDEPLLFGGASSFENNVIEHHKLTPEERVAVEETIARDKDASDWMFGKGIYAEARFKLKGEKDGKVANLKGRYNDTLDEQESAEAELEESKENVASEEDAHAYMKQKTKLAVSRKKLALLPAEIEIIRKVAMGERVVAIKEVSRKLKVQRALVKAVKVEIVKQPVKSKKLVSAFQHRMMGILDEQHQDDVTYNRKTKAEEVAKAEVYYNTNKKRTLAIALGKESAPADVSSNVISLTVLAKAQAEGDSKTIARVLPKLSLRATEQGQEISMLRDAFGARNPLSYMNKIIAQRKLLAKKKYKAIFSSLSEADGFEQLKKEKLSKAQKRAPKLSDLMTMKAKQIDDFLADITC